MEILPLLVRLRVVYSNKLLLHHLSKVAVFSEEVKQLHHLLNKRQEQQACFNSPQLNLRYSSHHLCLHLQLLPYSAKHKLVLPRMLTPRLVAILPGPLSLQHKPLLAKLRLNPCLRTTRTYLHNKQIQSLIKVMDCLPWAVELDQRKGNDF